MINNRYIVNKKLGEGRSKVFLCTDMDNPEKEYAIKILSEKANAEEVKIFRKEFFTLQNLNHPNIIASYEEGMIVKTDDEDEIISGSYYIVLDYFPGVELLKYSKLNEGNNLNNIIIQICSVLYYLHQSNYIYYDLKPENILVSESEGNPNIKLIDMGFAHHLHFQDGYTARGTKEYIAPEILKNEPHNHQVDLYSLGIVLYRIVYGKFPFKSELEIEILKEQIERNFEYPDDDISRLNKVIKKLLEKNPVNRYDNSLQVLKDIDENISQDIIKHFTPANVFSDRELIISQLKNYLDESIEKEVIILSGAEGSGKTSLMYKIYSEYEKVIIINSSGGKSGIIFVQYLLKKIIYSGFIYSFLDKELLEQSEKIISGNFENLIDNLKSIITKISSEIKFNIIIDDFNLLNEFARDVFREIIPILQVNGTNIILSERNDHPGIANEIFNKTSQINLSPFTEENLNSYIDISLANFFPKDQLKTVILNHSDLLPGSIINFIRDLILLQIINFTLDGPEIIENKETQKLLESSHEEIYRLRFSQLTPYETKIAQFLSAFENSPGTKVTTAINNLTFQETNNIIKGLEEKNILQASTIENSFSFSSDSIKRFIFSTIGNRKEYLLELAELIVNNFNDFNRTELARFYELGDDFISSYNVLIKEIENADKLSAFTYKKNLLNHLLHLPLQDKYILEIKYQLSFTYSKLNDAQSALNLIDEVLSKTEDEKNKNELLILKGTCLIELGEIEEGKNLLKELVEKIDDEARKQKLFVEIAYAEFDLGRYEVAKEICNRIINNPLASHEDIGKSYNLFGLINTNLDSDLNTALYNFQKASEMYFTADLKLNVAKVEVNMGNTYDKKGDYENAKKYWEHALQTNKSIGNLDQEAKLLINFGIIYYNNSHFNKAIEQYLRANDIFSSLGNRYGQGLALINLGETYLTNCDFQNAYDSLIQAQGIFSQILNLEEEAEIFFMLAKYYYKIGDLLNLEETINKFQLLINNANLPERYLNNCRFWEIVFALQEVKNKLNIEEIIKVFNSFKEQNEGGFFAEGYIIIIDSLIFNDILGLANLLLNDKKFLNICENNVLYNAWRRYLLGVFHLKDSSSKVSTYLQNLEEAHDLIKDEEITELTWKVLLSLGENFLSRGNYKKANEFLTFSKEVINFIASNIKDESLKSKYLSKPERKYVFHKIEMIQN